MELEGLIQRLERDATIMIERNSLPIDATLIAHSVAHILNALEGDACHREGLRDTPRRVAKAYQEMFSGYLQDPKDLFKEFDNDGNYDQMVVVRDIDFTSFCEHHMLPFQGVAHVGYLPAARIVGLSKLARVVDVYAKRLQVQERMTQQVVAAINDHLRPKGAGCVVEAKHLCLGCRGARKQNAVMVTSALSGAFRDDPATRAEFLRMIGH